MVQTVNCTINTMTTIGERVAEAINNSDSSVKEIADACGVSVQAVYAWRRGEVKDLRNDNLFALADATGFEARWIGTDKGQKKTQPMGVAQNVASYTTGRLSKDAIAVAEYYEKLPPEIRAEFMSALVKTFLEMRLKNPELAVGEIGEIINLAR